MKSQTGLYLLMSNKCELHGLDCPPSSTDLLSWESQPGLVEDVPAHGVRWVGGPFQYTMKLGCKRFKILRKQRVLSLWSQHNRYQTPSWVQKITGQNNERKENH